MRGLRDIDMWGYETRHEGVKRLDMRGFRDIDMGG